MGRTWQIFARICLLCGGNLSSWAFAQYDPRFFLLAKNFAKRQNIKDGVVLGWNRYIFEKSSQTIGITAATVNACQTAMKNDTSGKFNSSTLSLIMNVVGIFWPNAHTRIPVTQAIKS